MLSGRPTPSTSRMPSSAERQGAHALGIIYRQEGRDACTHRVAHDVGPLDFQVVEQRADISGHDRTVIGRRIVELCRRAVPAIVEGNCTAAGARERRHPAGLNPVHFLRGRKAVDEHERLAASFIKISDLDVAMIEARHARF